jgi:hypothetical protein
VGKKATEQVDTRKLLVFEQGGGKFIIEIPADWKITFGSFQQGKYGGEGGSALRIYEAENKQRACFLNVRSFRDMSLPIQRLVTTEQGEVSWVSDSEGNLTQTKKVKKSTVAVSGV